MGRNNPGIWSQALSSIDCEGHRSSFSLEEGEIDPDGTIVRTSCDDDCSHVIKRITRGREVWVD